MHYAAIVDGAEHQVEIIEVAANRFQVVIDGRTLEVDAQAVGETTLSLLHGSEAYNIESEKLADGSENLLVRGHIVRSEVLDLRRLRLRQAQASAAGPEGPVTITSPMPGKVVAVLVAEEQQVEQGQGLLVIEAMKMENELRSPRAGTVRKLVAKEGAAVEGGAVLCVVE
ncbi:MAG: biotin/lipoyl-containing protein [Myxococcota bacterium]